MNARKKLILILWQIAGIAVTNVEFGLVSTESRTLIIAPFDGLVGLGSNPTTPRGVVVGFFQRMMEQKVLDKPVFSFYLSR